MAFLAPTFSEETMTPTNFRGYPNAVATEIRFQIRSRTDPEFANLVLLPVLRHPQRKLVAERY